MQADHLGALARFCAGLAYEDVPPRVLRAAKLQLLDMIAAAHAAARAEDAATVLEGRRSFSGDGGRATVLATGERAAPCDAAIANAACSMAHDFDDIVWMGHTCHSAVFASLAVAEHERASARDLLLAIVVANEIGGRLGASSFLGPLNGQMWTFIHLVGAAAATAKLVRLDAAKTAHALAIALAQPNFALQPGFLSPSSKLLAASTPTATGIQAAYFARAGMTGHPRILDDARGFWRRFSYLPMPGTLGALGEFWTLDTLTVKTYPGCHYFQTALAAIDAMRARGVELSRDRVKRVVIDATKLACEATRFAADYVPENDLTAVGVNFSLAQSAALLLDAGRLDPDDLDDEGLAARKPSIDAWLAKIEVRHDAALTAKTIASARAIRAGREAIRQIGVRDLVSLARKYREEYRSRLFTAKDALGLVRRARTRAPRPAAGEGIPLAFPARVTVELASGAREIEEMDVPPGSIASPEIDQAVAAKLSAAMERTVGRARADELLALTARLEDTSLDALVRAASV